MDKKTYYFFNNNTKKSSIFIMVTKIYQEEHSKILSLTKNFKLCSININFFKNFNFYNQSFNLESCNFFLTEYFFQIMNGEVYLLRRIKISINFRDYYQLKKNFNYKQFIKINLKRKKFFNYKLHSCPYILILINSLNQNLYKKIFEISRLVLNFTWYQQKNSSGLFLNKKIIIKCNNLLELKFFSLLYYFLKVTSYSILYPIIEYFLFLLSC
jgi:hypothetical protein